MIIKSIKQIYVTTFLLTILSVAQATNNQRDSLFAITQNSTDDKLISKSFYFLSYLSLSDSIDLAISYCHEAEKHALLAEDKMLLANSYFMIGYLNHLKSDFRMAIRYYLGARKIYRRIGNHTKEQEVLRKIALLTREMSRYEASLTYSKERLKVAEIIGDSEMLQDCYYELGLLQNLRNNLPEAFSNFLRAKKIVESMDIIDSVRSADILLELGTLSRKMMQMNSMSYRDSALKYYNASKKLNTSKVHQSKICNNLGNLYLQQGEYDSALVFLLRAFELKKRISSNRLFINTYNNLGIVYFKQEKYDSASYYFQKAISSNIGNDSPEENIRDYNLLIAFQTNKPLLLSYQYLDSLKGKTGVAFSEYNIVSRLHEMERARVIMDQIEAESIMEEVFLASEEDSANSLETLESSLKISYLYSLIGTLIIILLFIAVLKHKKMRKKIALTINEVKREYKEKYKLKID